MAGWRKNILFTGILLILFLPLIQQKTGFVKLTPLTGDQTPALIPGFTLKSWSDGSFQNAYDICLEDRIGFRPWLVRMKNQIEFSLFRKANASGVIVGRKSYLFEEDYIRAYTGRDYLGDWFWNQKFRRMELVRDTLKSLGVELALILEPGKASYYPEYIPRRDIKDALPNTNYQAILDNVEVFDIPVLDLNSLFVSRKSDSPFPHFPKGGIHWSYSAMLEAVDTLLNFADDLIQGEIPAMTIKNGDVTKALRYTDSDLVDILNLVFTPHHMAMHYPEMEFETLPDSVKPRVLSISDSFFFNILNAGIPGKAFANEAFWYYSKAIYPETWSEPRDTSMINIRKEVESMDLILIMITERFYYKMAWNFIEVLYKSYFPEHVQNYSYDYQARIITDYKWFNLVVKDAEQRSISVAQGLKDHSAYQIWNDEQNGLLTKDAGYYVMKILKDSVWLSKIEQKANLKGISLEKQIELEAKWMELQN